MKNATINQKPVAMKDGRWNGKNDGGCRGNAIKSFWGKSSWAGGGKLGKIHQFIKLFYFSSDLKNEIKSFDAAINHPITVVLPGGTRERRGEQGIIVTYH